MRTINEVGMEILKGTPAKFYAMTGPEYGIKSRYIQMIHNVYKVKHECDNVAEIFQLMSIKHIVPLAPALYVVRYDEDFIAGLGDNTSCTIDALKILGTVVVIYTNFSHEQRLAKYLPDYTVSINSVDDAHIHKYLKSDFPKIPGRLIDIATRVGSDYGQSKNICRVMNCADTEIFNQFSDDNILFTFGYSTESTENQIKHGVAARDFRYLIDVLDSMSDVDTVYYAILSTMMELEKCKCVKYEDAEMRKYAKLWTAKDIYFMFMNTYQELKNSRMMNVDIRQSLVKLFYLLAFSEIPSLEEDM